MGRKRTGLIGLAAVVLFTTALIAFAAAYPGYEHATKAVSELGDPAAPHAAAWNVVGFFAPGVLLAVFGAGVGAAVGDRIAGVLFALSGAAFAATAIPADMTDLSSASSTAHIVASFAVFLFWLGGAMRSGKWEDRTLGRLTLLFLGLAIAAAAVRLTPLLTPGWGQRLSFAAYFGWIAAVSTALLFRRGKV